MSLSPSPSSASEPSPLPAAQQPPSSGVGSTQPARVVIITGLSGAGKTTALKVFEDLGYEAVDNPPLRMIAGLVYNDDFSHRYQHSDGKAAEPPRPLAIGVDVRSRDFDVNRFQALLRSLRHGHRDDPAADPLPDGDGALLRPPPLDLHVLFIDANDEVLVNRFTETRRRHPIGGDLPVPDGIALERALLANLRGSADWVIDTSRLTMAEFRALIEQRFATGSTAPMTVFVVSFGFRNGLPRSADLVFDVRFLRNPHYVAALRDKTGKDPEVQDYVQADDGFTLFFDHLTTLIAPLMPRYQAEGKKYLTIAVGCTGGKHRSVAVAEQLAHWLMDTGQHVMIRHRDCPLDATAAALAEGDDPAASSRSTATGTQQRETLP